MNDKRLEVILSEDRQSVTVNDLWNRVTHTFELVDFVLYGYLVWNIGKNMADGYLPLCRLCAVQPFPGGRNIEVETLKAVECKGARVILDAVHSGANTLAKMRSTLPSTRTQQRAPGNTHA